MCNKYEHSKNYFDSGRNNNFKPKDFSKKKVIYILYFICVEPLPYIIKYNTKQMLFNKMDTGSAINNVPNFEQNSRVMFRWYLNLSKTFTLGSSNRG